MTRSAIIAIATVSAVLRTPVTVQPAPLENTMLRAQLRHSAVPVLLPRRLPALAGPVRSISVLRADAAGYYVGYSPVAHCAGALSCAPVHVAGYHGQRAEGGSRDRSVRLADGTHASYRPADCSGASCTEASLTFRRGAALYELDANLAKENLAVLRSIYANLRAIR